MQGPHQQSPASLSAIHFLQQIECRYTQRPDGTLFVPGDLNISGMELGRLPDFSKVHIGGSFRCSRNGLTSLDGAPAAVGGDFACNDNSLASLKGAPGVVGGDFRCDNNRLTCLEGAPHQFSSLKSDLGVFDRWGAVPDTLRLSAATKARRAEDIVAATVLQDTLPVPAPLKIRHKGPG